MYRGFRRTNSSRWLHMETGVQSTMEYTPELFGADAITGGIYGSRDALTTLGLPTQLVARIIDFAEYWCVQHFSHTTE